MRYGCGPELNAPSRRTIEMATRRTRNSLRSELLPTVACTLLGCLACGTCAASGESVQATSNGASAPGRAAASLHETLDAEWEWRMAQFPESATEDGDHRYDDRLTDRSPAAVAQRR